MKIRNMINSGFLLSLIFTFPLIIPRIGYGQLSRLTILTSYPPEFYETFLSHYQALRPALQIQILNKKTTAGLEELHQGNIRKFDLFWSSSLDAFEMLKASGKLQRSEYQLRHKTIMIKDMLLHDPDGYYFSFALSSVGFMWNQHFLEETHLPTPASWEALADPMYYGHLAMSTPSRSGTTHLIVESILQSMGWQEGWAYLLKTAGNFSTITARSFSVPEGIARGRFGIGFVIDFLAQGQKSINPNIDFRYGEPTLLMPAGIALLKGGENIEEASGFIDYLLSPDGQKLLLDPSISRLPIIADMYAKQNEHLPELYRRIQQGKTQPFNTELSRTRYHVVNNLFDQLITYRLLERRRIWKGLIELEGKQKPPPAWLQLTKNGVLTVLTEIPVSERQSVEPQYGALLSPGFLDTRKSEQKRELLQSWDEFVAERLRQAQVLIDDARQKLAAPQK